MQAHFDWTCKHKHRILRSRVGSRYVLPAQIDLWFERHGQLDPVNSRHRKIQLRPILLNARQGHATFSTDSVQNITLMIFEYLSLTSENSRRKERDPEIPQFDDMARDLFNNRSQRGGSPRQIEDCACALETF